MPAKKQKFKAKMRPLFGNLGSDSSGSKNLVEFRAGKMHLRGTTVTADKRKGQVYVHQSDDSLMHFCWKDRTSGIVEDVRILYNESFAREVVNNRKLDKVTLS